MANPTEELVQSISEIPQRIGASACFGDAVMRDGHTIIPVARTSFGYGVGFGRGSGGEADELGHRGDGGEGEGGGGGAGGSATPVALIDITNDDVVIRPIMDPMRVVLSGVFLTAWVSFWLFWTMRTAAREHNKTRRQELTKAK
jgi:uncharacterized spore protein YtfJ